MEPSAVTDSDHDDGYQIEDNYNVHQDSDEQNIVEKIKVRILTLSAESDR